jgi:hypothetical protein
VKLIFMSVLAPREVQASALTIEGIEAIAVGNPTELEATPTVINVVVGSKPVR